ENGIPIDYIAKYTGKSTAYTAPSTSGTASGRKLEIGTVAVNPKIIPYGSLLYIMTTCGTRVYGAAIAADTGGFVHYTDRFVVVDVFMGLTSENYSEALRWGLREVDVYVINTGVY
ncbi:MAG: 3D domain-containing protein, partial [Oscillospiraceae bacterium]|nr:3D domain-containing protein [Oscillospiraceae bacterium]